MQYPDLDGKVVLITGGTSGIGYKIAEEMGKNGAFVVVNGRSQERGDDAVNRLRAICDRAEFIAGDCRRYDDAAAVVEGAKELGGQLDVLISAGAPGRVGPMPFADMTAQQIEMGVDDRLYPRIYPIHAALPSLRQSRGCVILLTTDAARHPTGGESIVGAVGAGIMLLTKTLAKEFAPDGVRINSLALTLTSGTPSWDRVFAEPFQSELFGKALRRFPFGRPPNVDEVASVAVFLASAAASQVTGQTLSVNGGLSFGGW